MIPDDILMVAVLLTNTVHVHGALGDNRHHTKLFE